MKFINLLLLSCITIAGATEVKNDDSWKLDGRLSGYFQKVDVENAETEKEGFTQAHELNLKYYGPLYDGKAGVEAKIRASNDERVQKNDFHFLYFKGYYTTKVWNFELGDTAAAMNSYVYGGSLKGLKVEYKSEEKEKKWDYKFIGGVKKSQWRETYQTVLDEPLDTYVAAFEAKYTHERAKEIAFSVAALKDDLDSAGNTTAPGNKGMVFGIEADWRFNKYITFKGKGAITRSTNDLRGGKALDTENAIQLRLLTRPVLSSVKSNFTYERISTDFISTTGSANADLERIENATSWRINNEWSSKLSLKASHDNLDDSLGDTQYTYYEALNFNYKPKEYKRTTVDFKLTNKDVQGRDVKTNQYTFGVLGNYRSEDGFRYGLGYDYSNLDDKNNSASSQTINNLRAIIGYKQKLEGDSSWRITATVDAQYLDQKDNQEDRYGLKLDAGYQYSKKLSMDLAFASRNSYKEDYDDTMNNTYQFRSTYRIDDRGKQIVRLLLEKNDYKVEDNSDSSYNEHIGKLSYVYNF